MSATVFQSPASDNFFVGYYDKSPFDRVNRRHLALRVADYSALPDASSTAEIGYFDLNEGGSFIPLTTTNAFNWQQGCMLQWLDDAEPGSIIFNRRIDEAFRAIVHNLADGHERVLSAPIYTVRAQGDLALSVDFERHYWCRRAYAYAGIEKNFKNAEVAPGDGLFLVDIATGEAECLVQVADLLHVDPLSSMRSATHYVEHMMFSPAGDKFVFYHRWKSRDGSITCRLYLMDLAHRRLRKLLDTGRLSHMCWLDEHRILAWGAPASLAGVMTRNMWLRKVLVPLKPLYRLLVKGNPKFGQSPISKLLNGDSYFTLDVDTGTTRRVLVDALDRDGHPSPVPGRRDAFITDTYPDRESRARVIWADLASGRTEELAVLDSVPEYDNTPIRCDLHPKVSKDGTLVSVDTMGRGHRGVRIYSLVAPSSE